MSNIHILPTYQNTIHPHTDQIHIFISANLLQYNTHIQTQSKITIHDIIMWHPHQNQKKYLIYQNGQKLIKNLNALVDTKSFKLLIYAKNIKQIQYINTMIDYTIYRRFPFPRISIALFLKQQFNTKDINKYSSVIQEIIQFDYQFDIRIIYEKMINKLNLKNQPIRNYMIISQAQTVRSFQFLGNHLCVCQNSFQSISESIFIIMKKQTSDILNLLDLSNIFCIDLQIELVNSTKSTLFTQLKLSIQQKEKKRKLLIIQGQIGAGKSFSLKWFFKNQIKLGILKKQYILIIDLKKSNLQSLANIFSIQKMIQHATKQQLIVIIVDGFKQYNKEEHAFVKSIFKMFEQCRLNLIVIMIMQIRKQEIMVRMQYDKKIRKSEIKILKLNDDLIDVFIDEFSSRNMNKKIKVSKINNGYDQIIRNPFLLNLIMDNDLFDDLFVNKNIKNRFEGYKRLLDQVIKYNGQLKQEIIDKINQILYHSLISTQQNNLQTQNIKTNSQQILSTYPQISFFIYLSTSNSLHFKNSYLHYLFFAKYLLKYLTQSNYSQNYTPIPFTIQQITQQPLLLQIIQLLVNQNSSNYYSILFSNILKTQNIRHKQLSQIAALSITILNFSGFNFSGLNLSNIQIPEANLSYGYFQQTNFQNSNLQNTNFSGSFCLGTNFTNTNMRGVKFGILPETDFGSAIMCIDIIDSGKYLIASGQNSKIKMYSLKNMKLLNTWIDNSPAKQLKIGNNFFFATSSDQQNIFSIWSQHCSNKIKQIQNGWKVSSIVFSNDFKQITVSGNSPIIKIWNIQTGLIKMTLEGHISSAVLQISLTKDGKKLVSAGQDKTLRIWDYQSGLNISVIQSNNKKKFSSVCWDPLQKIIVSSNQNLINIWDPNTLKNLMSLSGHQKYIYCLRISNDGKKLASSSEDKTVIIWDIETGKQIQRIQRHSGYVFSLCWTPDSKRLVSGSYDEKIKIWILQNYKYQVYNQKYNEKIIINKIIEGRNGNFICACQDSKIRILNSNTYQVINTLSENEFQLFSGITPIINSIAYCQKFNVIATGYQNIIRLWSSETDKCIQKLYGHQGSILSLCFSKIGYKIISGGYDNLVKVWDITLNSSMTLIGHSNQVLCVLYIFQGNYIASGSKDKKIILWNQENGSRIRSFQGHTSWILCINSVDSKLISGSADKKIKIWELETGILIKTLDAHNHHFYNLIVSPNKLEVASAGFDKFIKIWKIKTGQLLKTFQGHDKIIQSICYNSDGNKLLSCSKDRTLKIWQISKSQNSLQTYSNYKLIKSFPQRTLYLKNNLYKNVICDEVVLNVLNEENKK